MFVRVHVCVAALYISKLFTDTLFPELTGVVFSWNKIKANVNIFIPDVYIKI